MSMQPPWPDQPPSSPDPNQHPPPPRKKSALPWILAGAGVVVLVGIIAVVVIVAINVGGPERAVSTPMVEAPTESVDFQYPQGWVESGQNVTVIKGDGSSPAERFVAIDQGADSTSAMVVYEAGDTPQGEVTEEKVRQSIDAGLQGQLGASPEQLISFRSTSAFGCLSNFAYTTKPAIVERNNMYGYLYGYTCRTLDSDIEGMYLVAFDDAGISHRFTVEALQAQWDGNRATFEAMVDSLKPQITGG